MRRAALIAVSFTPALAAACDSCGGGNSNNDYQTKWAYQVMSAVLSLLPLMFIGSVIAFVVHKVRQAEREETAQAARLSSARAPAPTPPEATLLPGAAPSEAK
ncbi:MAG: hypothetical protein QM723_20935 [Myxococcaceae bacterium]